MLRELFDYAAIGGKVHAMLGNRLRQEDFDKLMQMHTVPETAAFLLNPPGWGNCLQGMDVEHVHRGELEKRLRTEIGFKDVLRSPIGPSVLTNTGPQALAVGYYGAPRG